MTSPKKEPPPAAINAALSSELHKLCSLMHDGVSTPEECDRFNQLLSEDVEARRFYLRYVGLSCQLMSLAGKGHSERADSLRRHIVNASSTTQSSSIDEEDCSEDYWVAPRIESTASRRLTWRMPLAAAAAILVVLTSLTFDWSGNSENTPAIASSGNPGILEQQVNELQAPKVAGVEVARCTFASELIDWESPKHLSGLSAIEAGTGLAFGRGEVELTYHSGTRILLMGPAEYEVGVGGGRLIRGGLVASVTEEGHGFTVETPGGRVVDLGTEFGVAVDDFGVSEVSVFEGEVEAIPAEPDGNKSSDIYERRIRLTEGRGLQWDAKSLRQLSAQTLSFSASRIASLPNGDRSASGDAVVESFADEKLDASVWRTVGKKEVTPKGLLLRGDDSPPYLVTTEQLDPSKGPISVTCDFRFVNNESANAATLGVLTRSAKDRGISLPPWQGHLASCARCSFEASSEKETAGGLLRSGVKMESSRELTSISTGSFIAPSVGTPFRMVVTDDGVNLTCSISLRDNPSESTSLTCRSLFRGGSNHIAIEGSRKGATLIERVAISQAVRQTPRASYASFSRLARHGTYQDVSGWADAIKRWTPQNGNLVVREHFNGLSLDPDIWESLGDVSVVDGVARLGAPGEGKRIDTWRQRPYLILKQSIDPQISPITVFGRVRFAENYLTGFGGTFGALTRAGDSHGDGPEWERSVLNRGLRATFWPAAWNPDRRLEIYERTESTRPKLLATRSSEVDPGQRDYWFCMVDRGDSVSLAVIDPARPDISKTIESHEPLIGDTGKVAFESCWGSPVELDDLHVFVGE